MCRSRTQVCPTSNVRCGTVSSYGDHHVGDLLRGGGAFSISTDDKGVFACTLTGEYVHVAAAFDLDLPQLQRLSRAAIELVFAGEDVKQRLRTLWDACGVPQ